MQVTNLLEQVQSLREEAEKALQRAETLEAVEEVRKRFLGRKGELNAILRSLSQLSPEERRLIGSEANALRDWLEEALRKREQEVRQITLQKQLEQERIDVTLPDEFGNLAVFTL